MSGKNGREAWRGDCGTGEFPRFVQSQQDNGS